MEDLVQWILSNKERLNLSQAKLGSIIGISQPQVSDMLNGSRKVQLEEIRLFEEHFGETYSPTSQTKSGKTSSTVSYSQQAVIDAAKFFHKNGYLSHDHMDQDDLVALFIALCDENEMKSRARSTEPSAEQA